MSGVVAAVYASFFIALAQASLKKSYRELEASVAFLFDALFGLVLWIPLAVYFGVNPSLIGATLPYAVVSAILAEALSFYALTKGELSVTAILMASFPIYTVIFSFFINHEVLSGTQALFVAVTIGGTLFTYLPSKMKREELRKSGALFWPILAAVAIGFSDTLSKHIINATGDFTFLFVLALIQIPVAWIFLGMERQSAWKNIRNVASGMSEYKNALAGSLFNIIGTGLMWISFSKTLASIASPITATSGAFVLILSLLFLDEKIRWRQLLGILLVFAGIIGISLTA